MKKVLSVLLALMMLAACGTVFAEQEARKIETPADADEWIATLFGEHPEELEDAWAMVPEVKTALAASGGMKTLAAQLAALGAAEKISPAYMRRLQRKRRRERD